MVYEKVSWIVKRRLVFHIDTGVKEIFKFLRMGYIDVYNDDMGDVDIIDQLKNVYQLDHWLRQRKW